MFSDFEDYSSHNGWDTEKHCHKIYAGQEKDSKKPIIISTWQSMQNKPSGYFQQFDIVVCDEVHLAKADAISKIVESSSNAYIRYGFTGTLQDTACHKLVILGHFGAEKRVIETKELMELGCCSQLAIKCVIFRYKEDDVKRLEKIVNLKKKSGDNGYAAEMGFIVEHENRMNNLVALILSLKKNSLVLFNLVAKHGKVVYNKLIEMNEKHNLGKDILFISGETEADIREDIRTIMEQNDNIILVASYGTTSTGVSIKNIENVIFASPFKSKIKVLQSIGRGLRNNKGKEKMTLYDVVDDLSRRTRGGNLKYNYVLKHFSERYGIYQREKFDCKTITRMI
jgi:superfamily II DNA or RNA helicase